MNSVSPGAPPLRKRPLQASGREIDAGPGEDPVQSRAQRTLDDERLIMVEHRTAREDERHTFGERDGFA
jgi:hypothetical protein